MTIHPLKLTFNEEVSKRYGIKLWGDKNPNRTGIVAQRINGIGITYQMFVVLALALWDTWSDKQDHEYPYWNVITSDKSFDRVKEIVDTWEGSKDDGIIDHEAFTFEIMFATDYIGWMLGDTPHKPHRVVEVSSDITISVAEYICTLKGLECISSDYNYIARQLSGY